jgi:hypothetical protein
VQLSTISGTSRNGKKARVLVQRRDLGKWGFECGTPIRVEMQPDHSRIVIHADPEGSRKIARVVDKRRDAVYQTVDLRLNPSDFLDIFKGSQALSVDIFNGMMIISAT